MKSMRLWFLIQLLAITTDCWTQGFLRTYNLDDPTPPNSSILTATPTPDGGFVFFGETTFKRWLAKTDPLGEIQWLKELALAATDVQADLFITPDGHYALANYIDNNFAANNFLLFDAQGNLIHQTDFTGFTRVVMTAGGFWASNRVNTNTYKLFRLDWQGEIVWEQTKTTSYLGLLYDMTATQDGGLCMLVAYDSTGNRFPKLIKADADGEVEWERSYAAQGGDFYGRLIQNAQGQFVFTNQFINTVGSVMLAANASGDSLWSKFIDTYAFGLCETTNGGYAITSEKPFSTGINLLKTDVSGNTVFEKQYNVNNAYGIGWDVRPTPDGGVLIGGYVDNKATLIKTDANGNIYPNFIAGKVAFDQNHDCQPGINEPPLKDWVVVATETGGQEYYATTDDAGLYELNVNVGNYTVEIQPPGPLWEPCDAQMSADLTTPSDTVNLDFPVQDSVLCSLLDVSVSTPFLRRCFDSQYFVSWCNEGTTATFDALIEIVLPPELDFVSASQPVTQSGDTLRFDLGTVGFGECGDLNFKVNVNCDSTVLGQTLCVEARIFPDTVCYEIPNWSGARVVATAHCLADTAVEFRLRNIGTAPTQTLDYIITEDLVVLMQGNFELDPQEEQVILRNANGFMQRIEAQQEPGYPFGPVSSAFVEGCGNAAMSFGLVNQFSLDDASPFTDIECREVVGSYDPNDKQGFPNGYGNPHLIEPGTDITYLIRFQNTGTDTAFTVTIRDTLSAWLDPATVRPGASSHAYTWELTGPGALAFHFANILLPDSNVNEPASHGFVQFRISQRAGAPLGTVIENDAAIFFDYNAPVITNTTFHTLGEHFYTVSVENAPGSGLLPVSVSPNPFRDRTVIALPEALPGEAVFRLFDQSGRVVRETVFSGNTLEFQATNLPSGLYFFEIRDAGGHIRSRGKMITN
ncbi:MAG: hypothetical protein EPGJADBJ_05423 [Saprospiraceae bacterium]|nr:hypothetical protein [Saprospiraceae bacterium]